MKNRVIVVLTLVIAIFGFALIFCRKEEPAPSPPPASKPKVASAGPLSTKTTPVDKPKVTESKPQAESPPPAPVPLTPEEEEKQARERAFTMYKWCAPYALDHGGAFPPDLSAIVGPRYGFDGENVAKYLRDVIEYRGSKLTTRDPAELLLMRYRIGSRKDKEVRLYLGGTVDVRLTTDPIPEDAPTLEPAK